MSESHAYSTTAPQGFYHGHHPGPVYTIHLPPLPVDAPPQSTISTTERERERERENREREREQRESRERGRELERERERDDPPLSKPGHVQFMTQARPPPTQCKFDIALSTGNRFLAFKPQVLIGRKCDAAIQSLNDSFYHIVASYILECIS